MESDSKDPRKQNSFYRRKKKKKAVVQFGLYPRRGNSGSR